MSNESCMRGHIEYLKALFSGKIENGLGNRPIQKGKKSGKLGKTYHIARKRAQMTTYLTLAERYGEKEWQ